MKIHSTARIHPTAILQGVVEVGADTQIGPYCQLNGPVFIGSNNHIGAHCVIGADASHRCKTDTGFLVMGNNNIVKEFTAIERGLGKQPTEIGNEGYFLGHCSIAHNSIISNDVTLSFGVKLAGAVRVQQGANIGMNVVMHQFSTVGAYAMVGMASAITKDVPPFSLVYGVPAKIIRLNTYVFKSLGLKRSHFYFQNGSLVSTQAFAQDQIREFEKHSGRKKRAMLFFPKPVLREQAFQPEGALLAGV